MIVSRWEALFPELNTRFINRGISGDRAINLKNRWQEECIDFAPDYVSILIGINESCIRYSYNEITTSTISERITVIYWCKPERKPAQKL